MRTLTRALVALLALTSFACSAQDDGANKAPEPSYELGTHFKKVKNVAEPADPKRVLVEEFFWYGCGHCFQFDPSIEAWLKTKPADVDFLRVPASLGRKEGVMHQKAFYTAKALGIEDQIHHALFDALHNKRQSVYTEQSIQALFNNEAGVLPDIFKSTFDGFAVDSGVRRATAKGKEYALFSVPTVVVGGKYHSTAAMAGGSFDDLIKVINFLIAKVREEQKG